MDGHYQFNKRFNHTYDIFCYVFYHSHYIGFCNFIYGYMGLFDIYSKEDWRTIMAEEKKIRLEKVLQDMSHSLNHIEDIMADDRELLVKLVKQNNSIVDFLKRVIFFMSHLLDQVLAYVYFFLIISQTLLNLFAYP